MLITTSNVKLIAKTDIHCYKVLYNNSEGSLYTYPRNYLIKDEVLKKRKSLKPKEASCMLRKQRKNGKKYYEITSGAIHVCTEKTILRNNLLDLLLKRPDLVGSLSIWEVIIPKGSWYFKDITGESLAAEQINLVNKCTFHHT